MAAKDIFNQEAYTTRPPAEEKRGQVRVGRVARTVGIKLTENCEEAFLDDVEVVDFILTLLDARAALLAHKQQEF